jgi:hypothetical protein
MTRDEFLTVREDLLNNDWKPRATVLASTWRYMEQVPPEHIQVLVDSGDWVKSCTKSFHIGRAYRVDPNWAGPAEDPKPAEPTFVDVEVKPDAYGVYCFQLPARTAKLSITNAPAVKGFIGYVYYRKSGFGGTVVYDDLQFDKDGLMVPDAVRFRK